MAPIMLLSAKEKVRFLLVILLLVICPIKVFAMDLWVTSPWLSVIAHFMGGVFINVKPIGQWTEDGIEKKVSVKKLPKDGPFLALDYKNAQKYGLSSPNFKNIHVLYSQLPFPREEIDRYFTDPSVLPFIAQRILNVFSSLDSEHYSFYQRRLAEFQGRLESTVYLGRQLLQGKEVYSLSEDYIELLKAAQCRIIQPEETLRKAWEKGESLDQLKEKIKECSQLNIPVLYDHKTPAPVKKVLLESKSAAVIQLKYPTIGQDLIIALYDQYLAIWNIATPGDTKS